MLEYLIHIAPLGTFLATILWCLIGLPTIIGAYYQSWRARQEARAVREGTLHAALDVHVTARGQAVGRI